MATLRTAAVAALVALTIVAGCAGGDDRADTDGAVDSDLPAAFTSEWPRTDFSRTSVDLGEIVSGGPPKDGIPAIDTPAFVPVAAAGFLDPREPVISVEIGGQARAYPLQILVWHEIVNDTLTGVPVAVTFCPLCNTAIVFDRRLDGKTLDFGTTGRLRKSDLVMYDRQTESWWQQFSGQAIVGKLNGMRLTTVPARMEAWEAFRASHPDGTVLSRETGFDRDYGSNPYIGYDDIDSPPIFPSGGEDDDRLEAKERVVYIERGTEAVAIPFSVLERRAPMTVQVGGVTLTVRFAKGAASALDAPDIADGRDVGAAEVVDAADAPVPFHEPFWFAVAGFRPDVRIIR